MTQQVQHCAWCGGAIPESGGPGRPRRYCRRSHRQRAFEARRLGEARGLGADEAIVSARELATMADQLYLLQAALDDTADDLRGNPSRAEVEAAYRHLRTAAAVVAASRLEPSALVSD
ncbi:MAG: hypothetical protein MUP76_02870 [Acidimicrobiia bacterium]|nr:hypothetical protein [Acidimicrobiia bacterium]